MAISETTEILSNNFYSHITSRLIRNAARKLDIVHVVYIVSMLLSHYP